VLVLDDCSPDATPEIAKLRHRVHHCGTPPISAHAQLQRGISMRAASTSADLADDRLRRPYVLDVRHPPRPQPDAGYVFCPVMRFRDGRDNAYGDHGDEDRVFTSEAFARALAAQLGACRSASPAIFYESFGMFPLISRLPATVHVGAVRAAGDVGYLARADGRLARARQQHDPQLHEPANGPIG